MSQPFFFLKLNEEHFTFHLQYKHSGTFANRNLKNFIARKIQTCATPL